MRTAKQFHEGKDPVFRQITADAAFLRNLLRAAKEKQKDSENDTVSLGTRVEAAYDAALNICLVVIAIEGYRVQAGEGHHSKAIEAACGSLGASQGLYERLDALRDTRHGKYAGIPRSEADLKDALHILRELHAIASVWIERRLNDRPELRRGP